MTSIAFIAGVFPLVVARGAGRAYGDAAIGTRSTLWLRDLNRMRGFNPATGRLTVEAGKSRALTSASDFSRRYAFANPVTAPPSGHVAPAGS